MKKILRYVIIIIVAILIFMFIDNVYALGNTGPFSGLTISEQGNFIRNNGSTTISLGFGINNSASGTGVLDGSSYYYASPKDGYNLTYGDNGISLLQCDMSFVEGNYYSVSYYFVSDSFAYYYHPSYSNLTNKVAISSHIDTMKPNFAYEVVSNDIQYKLVNNIGYVQSYTIIFKAPNTGTCLLSNFNSNPSGNALNISYVGYDYKHLGTSSPSASEISSALSGSFDEVSSKIDAYTQATNDRLDELNQRQEEQNQTSKGIWQSLKDGISSIGNWFSSLGNTIGGFFTNLWNNMSNAFTSLGNSIGGFFSDLWNNMSNAFSSLGESIGNFFSDLWDNMSNAFSSLGESIGGFFSNLWKGIQSLFIGEEVCTDVPHEVEKILPPKPFYTFNSSDYSDNSLWSKSGKISLSGWNSTNNFFQNNIEPTRYYYIKTSSSTLDFSFQLVFYSSDNKYIYTLSLHNQQDGKYIEDIITNEYGTFFKIYDSFYDGYINNSSYYGVNYYNSFDTIEGIYTSINPIIEYETVYEQDCHREGGLFGMISDFKSAIGKWFSDLLSGILDGIKSLFVPTDDQLYEIIEESKELTENFGFVGESVNFFLTIFTALLGLVNANGCVELPEFSMGETSLFPSHTFWEAQNVCLNDNVILSSNITTIRTITSIVLVAMFINFAASKFFSILSKNDYGSTTTYDSDGSAQTTDWSRVNGDTTIYRGRKG